MTIDGKGRGRATDADEARDLVHAARIEHAICAVRGHRWPEVDPREEEELPENFRVGALHRDGCFDVQEICARCGEDRWSVSTPGNIFRAHRRTYGPPPDRPVIARGVSRSVYAAELDALMNDKIMAAAAEAGKAAERARAKAKAEAKAKKRKDIRSVA